MERVEWADFVGSWRWLQGEHVSLIGPTGSGKTTLAQHLLPWRRWTIVVASKPRDVMMDRLCRDGYARIREWPAPPLIASSGRIVLWPPMRTMGDTVTEAAIIGSMLEDVYRQGSWTVVIDELGKVSRDLGHDRRLRLLWQQGRSLGVSIVGLTQRPAWVPVEAYSQATHLFFWRNNDLRDLRRIADVSGTVDSRATAAAVQALPEHEVLYVNSRTGMLAVTNPPPL